MFTLALGLGKTKIIKFFITTDLDVMLSLRSNILLIILQLLHLLCSLIQYWLNVSVWLVVLHHSQYLHLRAIWCHQHLVLHIQVHLTLTSIIIANHLYLLHTTQQPFCVCANANNSLAHCKLKAS